MLFTWTGASVEIPYKVHKLLSYLGPKLYFYRIPLVEKTEDEYFERKQDDFHIKRQLVKSALFEYLFYFEMNPDIVIEEEQDTESMIWNGHANGDIDNKETNEDGMLPKIEMHPEHDDPNAYRMIIRLALMLAHLRASVVIWDAGTQGSDYQYRFAHIEEASRAITQMYNFARGNALSEGRLSITLEDIPIVIHTVLSTASNERVKLFELLIEHRGVLTTDIVCKSFDITAPTARRTMTELRATKLVDDISGTANAAGHYNAEMTIKLKPKFDWVLTDEFRNLKEQCFISTDMLKEKYPPHRPQNKGNEEQTDESIPKESLVPHSSPNDPLPGGEIPFNISTAISESSSNISNENELNGGNYERKGISRSLSVYMIVDCRLFK